MGRKTFHQESLPFADVDWQKLFGYRDHASRCSELIQAGNLPQALLIEGREGMGKRIFAAQLAALFFCPTSCGQCADCADIRHFIHPDILWIEGDGKSALKVSDADQVFSHLATAAGIGRRLVIVIDFDLFTPQAMNRLLKVLEEPPSSAGFILTSSKPDKLLPTILSRVVPLKISPRPMPETLAWLRQKFSGPDAPADTTLAALLRLSGHAVGRAMSLLETGVGNEFQFVADLLSCKDPAVALQIIKEKIKRGQIGANELAKRIEVVLNQYYKTVLGLPRDVDIFEITNPSKRPDAMALLQGRQLLRNLKALALYNKVPLNAQLAAEAWALGSEI